MEEYCFQQSYRLKPSTLLKVTLVHGFFSRFLNCANGAKLRKVSHMIRFFVKDIWFFSCTVTLSGDVKLNLGANLILLKTFLCSRSISRLASQSY